MEERSEGQNPLVHESAVADDRDSNERADDRVDILQPDGEEEAPVAEDA